MEYMLLKIYIENEELKLAYIEHIEKHNKKILESKFPDAGFDLLTPENINYDINNYEKMVLKIDYKIKCCLSKNNKCVSYYVYPRSSLATKTNLRMANSVGIIDQAYIGSISGVFDIKSYDLIDKQNEIEKYSRLVQICAPDLCPILVEIVEKEKDLPNYNDERKYGGFGSTG